MSSIQRPAAAKPLRKIHLVSKSHLDLGFTDQVDTVVDLHLDRFLPRAIEINDRFVELGRNERFTWTTGSWLIMEALERARGSRRSLIERGIETGALVWHALPFTSHTEFLSADLARAGLKISRELDNRFGRTTIAAKLTDVPGHSRALVPLLVEAGVEFLHVGVNGAIVSPDVPGLFRWVDADSNSAVTVLYSREYGGYSRPAGSDVALDVLVLSDNDGPPSMLRIVDRSMRMKQEHPGAEVAASTLDDFARDIRSLQPDLPTFTAEIGDNWIYGTGSDPQKVSDFRLLARLHSTWVAEGASPAVERFARRLMLVGEHAWGLDTIVHLPEPDYSEAGFKAARREGFYSEFERSWRDQRAYLAAAVDELDEPRRSSAQDAITKNRARPEGASRGEWNPVRPGEEISVSLGDLTMSADAVRGELIGCPVGASGLPLASQNRTLGQLRYQTYGSSAFDAYRSHYVLPSHQSAWWVDRGFGRHGYKDTSEILEVRPEVRAFRTETRDNTLVIDLILDFRADGDRLAPGAPRDVVINYTYHIRERRLRVGVTWESKAALLTPEALWVGVDSPGPEARIAVGKLGVFISAHDTVRGGGRGLHVSDRGIRFETSDVSRRVVSYDTGLVSLGDSRLLTDNSGEVLVGSAAHFNIFNNIWSTNFPLWVEGPASFDFDIWDE